MICGTKHGIVYSVAGIPPQLINVCVRANIVSRAPGWYEYRPSIRGVKVYRKKTSDSMCMIKYGKCFTN